MKPDQIVLLPIMGVLYASLGIGQLSAIKLRQWVKELCQRSILLGDLADGVSMHGSFLLSTVLLF